MEMREHKKETKCGFGGVSMYDQQGIEKKLADMARKGWLIEEMQNAFFWNYRRIEPKELHFAAVYAAMTGILLILIKELLDGAGNMLLQSRLMRTALCGVLASCAFILQRTAGSGTDRNRPRRPDRIDLLFTKTPAVLFRYHFIRTVLHHYGHKKCDNRLPRLKRSPVLAPCLLGHLVLLHALSALG